MTIIIDDAGSGDLLFGVVIGAYRSENKTFKYDVIDVKFFQPPLFHQKEYLHQASEKVVSLLDRLQLDDTESILLCQSYLFDLTTQDLIRLYGPHRIHRIKVVGEPQFYTETAYLDEIRNLGYEPLDEREMKRGKSFFHMMRWLAAHKNMMKYVKTGWPRLSRYPLFKETSCES